MQRAPSRSKPSAAQPSIRHPPAPGPRAAVPETPVSVPPERDQATVAQERARQTAQRRWQEQVQQGQDEQMEIVKQLELWKGKCVVCFQARQECAHNVSRCITATGRKAEAERDIASKPGGIVFDGGVVYYRCGVPRGMCDRWIDDSVQRSGRGCQY